VISVDSLWSLCPITRTIQAPAIPGTTDLFDTESTEEARRAQRREDWRKVTVPEIRVPEIAIYRPK